MSSFCSLVSICSALNCRIQQAIELGYKQLLFAADLFSLTFQLYCSHGRNAPCSLWGKAIAISWWADTGAEDRGCYTGPHASAQSRHLFYASGAAVLCCSRLFLLYSIMFYCSGPTWCRSVSVVVLLVLATSHSADTMMHQPEPRLRRS